MATKKAAKKSAGSKSTAAKSTRKTASKKTVKKSASSNDNYTDPDLREKIKAEVMRGDKGGRPNQWSARKAQLVAHEYEAQGGGYKHARNEEQQHLKDWGDEKWHTADGKPAVQAKTTSRYLPDKAWEQLSPAEKKATDAKKRKASKTGQQFVANTEKAKNARKRVAAK